MMEIEHITKTHIENENILNDILNDSVPRLTEEFKPYVNSQILKVDLNILKKVNDKLNIILEEIREKYSLVRPLLYLKTSEYSIYLFVRIYNNDYYQETYKYICNIKNLNIIDFYPFDKCEQIDYNIQLNIIHKAISLKKLYEQERNKIHFSLREKFDKEVKYI